VLCDHHPLILDAVERVLTSLNVEVRGRATSPGEALAAIEAGFELVDEEIRRDAL